MVGINQFLSSRSDVFHPGFVRIQFLFEILVFLHLATQIGGVQVAFVGRKFQFFVDPAFGFVTIAFELLQFISVFQKGSS